MKNIVILGGNGMLGYMLVDYLSKNDIINTTATVRSLKDNQDIINKYKNVKWVEFNVGDDLSVIDGCEYIINAIGTTKPRIDENNLDSIKNAIEVNSVFPYDLAIRTSTNGQQVIQILTDCVFSGTYQCGDCYTEKSYKDATDIYGKSKILGEVVSRNVYNLRCSIIGPEFKRKQFLLEWVRNQHTNVILNGFSNHYWNGITTLHFAKICESIIVNELKPSNSIQHIAPSNVISKLDLIRCISNCFDRKDIVINEDTTNFRNMMLGTNFDVSNDFIWKITGYELPPTIEKMVEELVTYINTMEE